MQKQILYTSIASFFFLISCASSKKKTPETVTTIYTTEINLEQPTPNDTLKMSEIMIKQMPTTIDNDPIDGGGQMPKQNRKPASQEEKEKIKQMLRERIKVQQKKG